MILLRSLKNIEHIPQDAIMVTADVVDLYLSIPKDTALETSRKALDNRENKRFQLMTLPKSLNLF